MPLFPGARRQARGPGEPVGEAPAGQRRAGRPEAIGQVLDQRLAGQPEVLGRASQWFSKKELMAVVSSKS